MDTDNDDDIAQQVNTPTLAESLLYSLERATGGIGLHVNADKIEFKRYHRSYRITKLQMKVT